MAKITIGKYGKVLDVEYDESDPLNVVTKIEARAISFDTVDAFGNMYTKDTKIGAGVAFDATKWHTDDDGVMVIDEARLSSISLVPYNPGDERFGVYPIQRGVEPMDAAIPLPALPTDFAPTDAEIQKAVNSFDQNTELEGLLDAEVVDE